MSTPDTSRPPSAGAELAPPEEMGQAADLRAVSADEAIAIAIVLQKNGRLEDAADVYQKVAAVAPDHPVALHYAGVLAHQQGRSEEAIALIRRSLEVDPGQADWHSNLGIVLKAVGRVDDAIFAYRQAIAIEPGHAKAHNNLAVALRSRGSCDEAEIEYRTAIRLDADYGEAYHNLGTLLAGRGRVPEAVTCFNKALVLSPETKETRRLLALAYCALGERHKAVDIYERWLKEEPDSPIARHMLAACSGEGVPERASDAYIEKCFDDFARTFDDKLARLAYRAPQLVTAMLADTGVAAAGSLDVLDAGCGTGLCGPLLRPYARRLVGIDLSGAMLAEARKRNVYDETCKQELTEYLRGCDGVFDVIVSADTLVYFGSLKDVAAAATTALRPGGWLIFTVEECQDPSPAPSGYELQTHGRYAHNRDYVEELLQRAGLRTTIVGAELRTESGLPVKGLVVRGKRPMSGEAARSGVNDG